LTGPETAEPLWRERARPRDRDVYGIGQNALDRVVVVERLPQTGEKHALRESHDRPGGQVATAVLACARLGLRCAYAGRVGDDAAGAAALAPLRQNGVDVGDVSVVPDTASQTAVILVAASSGERTILWHRPPGLRMPRDAVEAARIEGARVLLLDAGDPEMAAHAAQVARAAGVPVVLDADRYLPELDLLLSYVDFPLVSERFSETFTGNTCIADTLAELSRRGARLAAVTRGAQGVAARCDGRSWQLPAWPVVVVDTTGAGDVFHGAFAWALLEGRSADEVLRAANVAAGLSCCAAGAQGALADREKLLSALG
jgi:sulfofructose kinase